MVIQFEASEHHVATAAAAECAVILQRYGIAATYESGHAHIDVCGPELPVVRIPVATIKHQGRNSFSIADVLQQLAAANLIPASVIKDEALLLDRLVDLGYI